LKGTVAIPNDPRQPGPLLCESVKGDNMKLDLHDQHSYSLI
jgi:hypothetical protein